MRQVIGDNSYDTSTAAEIYRLTYAQQAEELARETGIHVTQTDHEETLFFTRGGSFFLHKEYDHTLERDDEIEPLTHEAAKRWLTKHANHRVEDVFGKQLEAGQDQETIYLRVPKSFKSRIEVAAQRKGQDTNAFVIRILEQFLERDC